MTTNTKLAGLLQDGDAVNVEGERGTVSSVEVYDAAGGKRVEFLVQGSDWVSAVDLDAGDAVVLWVD